MDSNYAKYREVAFFRSLDGIRALSIIAVIWLHCWWGTPFYSRLEAMPVLRQGAYGVHIFFAVSGFLITTLLLREKDRQGAISLPKFYMRRALRIWPLYYAVLALYVVFALTAERDSIRAHSFFHYVPSFVTFTYTWFISASYPGGMFNLAWTLATEEQFYAVWPVVLKVFRGWMSSLIILGTIALKVATDYHLTNGFLPPGWLPTRIVLSIAVPICLGVLLAQLLHWEPGFRFLYIFLGQKWSAPFLLVAMLLSLAPQAPTMLLSYVCTTAMVGACVIREDNGLAKFWTWRPMALIGSLSYGMYLFNSLVIHGVHSVLARLGTEKPPLIFVFAVAVATGMAYLSHRYFETPFLTLKKRYSAAPGLCKESSERLAVAPTLA